MNLPIQRIGRCYRCDRFTYFTRQRKALCKRCHQRATIPTTGTYPKHVDNHKHRTTFFIREQRRRVIRKLKRCQLCGATTDLTAHHIGGSTELGLTCLCRTCHCAYERWHIQHQQQQQQQQSTQLNNIGENHE